MAIKVEVTRLSQNEHTNPRRWDALTTIASSNRNFVGDRFINGVGDFPSYLKSLGSDLIYLHFYYRENEFTVAKRCIVSGWDNMFWAGVMHAKRSNVLKRFSGTKLTPSFHEHCQLKLNDLVAYYKGDVFNIRVVDGRRELSIMEAVYGVGNMQRHVAEFLEEYNLDANSVNSGLSFTVSGR